MFIASYDSKLGWTQLQPVSGFIAGDGQIAALVNHFSLFTILAQIEPEKPVIAPPEETPPVITPPVITPPVQPLLPARFEVSNMTLSAKQVKSGEPITIRVRIKNKGELSGEHMLTLKVNGLFVDSELVRLAPEQNRNVSFNIAPYAPGIYEVEIDGLREIFIVLERSIPDTGLTTPPYWPVPAIPIIIGVCALLAVLAVIHYATKKRK